MRNNLIFCMFVAAAALMLLTAVASGVDRRSNGDSVSYDVAAEQMFEGTIAGKGHIVEGLMYFPLNIKDALVEVQIGPKEFVTRSSLKLKPGETITVIGIRVVMNERDVLLAREIRSMNGVLILRDDSGVPLWEPNRPIQMDPERQTKFFETCEMF